MIDPPRTDDKGDHPNEPRESRPQKMAPLDRLKGSVERYDRSLCSTWHTFFSADGVIDDFKEDRNQPSPPQDTGGGLMVTPYITDITALRLMHTAFLAPLWITRQMAHCGQNYADTFSFFDDQALVDMSKLLAQWKVETPLCMSTSYERAVFDPLHIHSR